MKSKGVKASIFGFYAAYFLCYLIKISPTAIMPQVQVELNLTSAQVGLISSMYFFPYAISQFFIGTLCIRYTPHIVCSIGMLLSVAGLALFGFGNTVFILTLGRFLLGLGTSPFFISLIYYLQQTCKGDEYVRIYGYGIFVGNIASAIASYPIQAFLAVSSRQALSVLIGVITVSLAFVLLVLKKSSEVVEDKENTGNILSQVVSDITYTFKNPLLIIAILFWIVQSSIMMSYQGLWCVKWTATAFGSFASFAGLSGVFVSLGVILSGAFSEKLRYSKNSRGVNLFFCGVVSFVAVLFTVAIKLLPESFATFALALISDVFYGYAGGSIIVQGGAFVKVHTESGRNAGVMGVLNGFGCFAQQLSQWLTGIGIDFFVCKATLKNAFGYTYLVVAFLIAVVLFFSRRLLKEK